MVAHVEDDSAGDDGTAAEFGQGDEQPADEGKGWDDDAGKAGNAGNGTKHATAPDTRKSDGAEDRVDMLSSGRRGKAPRNRISLAAALQDKPADNQGQSEQ